MKNDGGLGFIGHYEQPFIAKAIKPYLEFWCKHWHVLLPTFTAAAVALFIHFHACSNSSGEAKQVKNHQVTTANHVSSK